MKVFTQGNEEAHLPYVAFLNLVGNLAFRLTASFKKISDYSSM
jgi:hypothetical protein